MATFSFTVQRTPLCRVTGLNGLRLNKGHVITLAGDGEAAIRAVVMTNGLYKSSYELPGVGSEPGAHHTFLKHNGAWIRLGHTSYGDWSFFVAPIVVPYDEIEVLEATDEYVEVAYRLYAHALNVPYLSNYGITQRDPDGNANYTSGAVVKAHTVVRVTKLQRIERNVPGVFQAWHSEPRLAPSLKQLTAGLGNNETDFGERELGPGYGSVVAFSSNLLAGKAVFPYWSERQGFIDFDAFIGGAGLDNKMWCAGLDDMNYSSFALPEFWSMTQFGTAPREQDVGPWWIADLIPSLSVSRCAFQQNRLEAGCWGFGTGQNPGITNHFCHSYPDEDGRMKRYQIFQTAQFYTANAATGPLTGYTGNIPYYLEPTQELRDNWNLRASQLVWPQ